MIDLQVIRSRAAARMAAVAAVAVARGPAASVANPASRLIEAVPTSHLAALAGVAAYAPCCADVDVSAVAWTDSDIARFLDRRARLLRWGWTVQEAEALAERLVKRDREQDERVSCTECQYYRPGRCGYQIYKQLIGFEGIHGKWEELKRSEMAWDYSDDKRQQAATQFVDEITDDNYAVWRDRILDFSRTRSEDMATFPVYYEFLKSRRHDAGWANVVWFNRDFRKLVEAMEPAERAEVLASMKSLTTVDYQAEEVLYAIGQHDPRALLDFLMVRVREELARDKRMRDVEVEEEDGFEAIPDNLHTLDKLLAKMPEALLAAVRHEFNSETAGMFPYYGSARLIKAVFPTFEGPLQDQLLTYVRTANPADIEFVVAVLRAYGGAMPILPICKEIIKVVPERSSVWNDVAAAFESTGVVSGEYGMVRAYEATRDEMAPWMDDDNPRIRAFAVWLTESLNQMIVHERQRADESLALRKHKYGVDKGEAQPD